MNADKNLIAAFVKELQKYNTVEKAVLFGSRARGDGNERSDYDVAIYGELSANEKTALRYNVQEELPTLHKIDLVFMNEAKPPKFIANIEKDGITFYDAKSESKI